MTTKLNEPQIFAAAHEMSARGGGFASAIADAFFRADTGNRAILLDAFAPLFARYAPPADAALSQPASPPPHLNTSNAIAWQTGRSYGVFGQRMAALITQESRILFFDLDRGIEGLSNFTTDAPLSIDLVMSTYDNGHYTNPSPMSSHEEALNYLREEARKVPYGFGRR